MIVVGGPVNSAMPYQFSPRETSAASDCSYATRPRADGARNSRGRVHRLPHLSPEARNRPLPWRSIGSVLILSERHSNQSGIAIIIRPDTSNRVHGDLACYSSRRAFLSRLTRNVDPRVYFSRVFATVWLNETAIFTGLNENIQYLGNLVFRLVRLGKFGLLGLILYDSGWLKSYLVLK